MRSLVVVVALLAGCELKPGPKKSPEPAAKTAAGHADDTAGPAAGSDNAAVATPQPSAPSAGTPPPAGSGSAADAGSAAPGAGSAGAPVPPPTAPAVPAKPDVSAACLDLAAHITKVAIASAPDAKTKLRLEQDRDRYVRRAAATCMRANYSDQVRACMLKATTNTALEACAGRLSPKRDTAKPRPKSGP